MQEQNAVKQAGSKGIMFLFTTTTLDRRWRF